MAWKQKTARVAVALFFAVLLAIGLATCADYGLPCDEPAEQVILQENMHEYACRLLGADSRAAQWYQSRGIDRISNSVEKDHGQSAYYAFMPLLARFANRPHMLTVLWKAYTWLLFMLGCGAIYSFCRQTGIGRFVSCIGALLLYLCPRFFAEGHYNNKDMVLLSLVLCTLYLGIRFLKEPGFGRGALFSLAGALAANTKIAGALGWGLMGLAAIVLVTASHRWSRRMTGVAAATIALFVAFYALLTPASWTDPAGYLGYLLANASGFTRWTGVVVFRGMVFDHAVNPLPRYYLIWMMLATLPLYVAPLAAMGQLNVIRQVCRQRVQALRDPVSLSYAAATLCWLVPLAAAVVMRPLVYNGWRHFYFVYAGIVLLAARGVQSCLDFLKRHGGDCGMPVVFLAGLLLFFGWTAKDMAANHPYQYGYYNLLANRNAETEMELDYWDVSTKNAMEALLTVKRNEKLPLVLGGSDPMSWFGVSHAYEVMTPDQQALLTITPEEDPPYLFVNTTYALIYGIPQPEGYRKLLTIESYGNTLCAVYEKR